MTSLAIGDVPRVVLGGSVPARPVTSDMIAAARGVVPLELVSARILAGNPSLNASLVAGDVGGLAMTSLDQAIRQLAVDPSDPWSSYALLCFRLLNIAEVRLARYAAAWDEVFSPAPISGAKHLWTSCYAIDESQFPVFEYEQLLASLHVVGLSGLTTTGRVFQRPASASAACACCFGACAGAAAAFRNQYVRCNDLWDYARLLFVDGNMPINKVVLFGLAKPARWPLPLLRDQGFWALVLMEEAGADVDPIWEALLANGLPGLLAFNDQDLAFAIGYMMSYHDVLLDRPLAPVVGRLIEQGLVPSTLTAVWAYARRVLQLACGTDVYADVEWDNPAGGAAVDTLGLLISTRTQPSGRTCTWAGMAHCTATAECLTDAGCKAEQVCARGVCVPKPGIGSGSGRTTKPRSIALPLLSGVVTATLAFGIYRFLRQPQLRPVRRS